MLTAIDFSEAAVRGTVVEQSDTIRMEIIVNLASTSTDRPNRGTRRMPSAVLAAVVALVLGLGAAACGSTAPAAPPHAAATVGADLVDPDPHLVRPEAVHIDPAADPARARAVVATAQRLYTFWNTGDTRWLDAAITPTFVDHTLPAGRPQGPAGPATASAAFRAAVPDLTCELTDLDVTGDRVTARQTYRGHATGTYQGKPGGGGPVQFNAIDIQHVGAGDRITEDWHLEDNQTFAQQFAAATR